MTSLIPGRSVTHYRLSEADCHLDEFVELVTRATDPADYPHAADARKNVLIYDSAALRPAIASASGRAEVEAELVSALTDGPGVVVFTGAYGDHAVVDRATAAFDAIIAAEESAGAKGDHFAAPGANSRIWNALEKLAVHDPEAFVDYYANDIVELISTAWLGPGYQMTSQVNVVRPGGKAQDPHRDYHLGFLSNEVAAQYPGHVHRLSPVLTLQGAVAHSDMPLESGPTYFLPFSQQYLPGYLAWRLPQFREYFDAHYVQLPLAKGDAVFFNPALFHCAGSNVSADVQRMANLLQVSSAFGRAMETVDRTKVAKAVLPVLAQRRAAGRSDAELRAAIASAGEGYPFPTNLDRDQPIGGLTPLIQTDLLWQAVSEGWDLGRAEAELDAYAVRRSTDDI